mmetsp:Transcript_31198/g.65927  ORF Transcript_31198/g.65927 Transcript_31198/m.65927 type:complete len:169 (+) Transcript_31198:121-627(+)
MYPTAYNINMKPNNPYYHPSLDQVLVKLSSFQLKNTATTLSICLRKECSRYTHHHLFSKLPIPSHIPNLFLLFHSQIPRHLLQPLDRANSALLNWVNNSARAICSFASNIFRFVDSIRSHKASIAVDAMDRASLARVVFPLLRLRWERREEEAVEATEALEEEVRRRG